MATKYPAQIDDNISLPLSVDLVTNINAEVVNELREAIIAIEEELGVKPSSVFTNVRTRLDNMDGIISSLQIIKLAGDLGGTLDLPRVIGLHGITLSSVPPTTGQVLKYNGLSWVPSTVAATTTFTLGGDLGGTEFSQLVIGIRGRPITATPPSIGEALVYNGTAWAPGTVNSFTAAGDLSGSNVTQTVIRLQGHALSSALPNTNDVLTWTGSQWQPEPAAVGFSAGGDLSGTATSQNVLKIHGATVPIAGSLTTGNGLYVSGGSALSYSALNLAGGTNFVTGILPVANGGLPAIGSSGQILSVVSATPTWVPQTPNIYEIVFVGSLQSTNLTAYDRKGARKLNMALYPATIGALTRTVTFVVDIQKTAGASSVDVQLFDVTHSVQVTGTALTYAADQTLTGVASSALTVGSSAGNLRNDIATMYEVSMKMSGGVIGIDTVYLNNARINITYA